MRIAIIILIVIVVAFIVVAVMGGRRSGGVASDDAPPQKENGEVDEDALSDWKPPSMAALMAKISAPFAPKLKLANPHIVLAANGTASRGVPSSTSKMRVARVELKSGAGLLIQYACISKDGRECPETVCICAPGALFTSMQISNCPDGWRNKRLNGNVCTADDAKTSLVIYPEPGALGFAALGQVGATAEIK